MKKKYNLNETNNATTNPNNCVATPDGGDTKVATNISQTWAIVVPISTYHKADWLTKNISNPAEVIKSSGKIWLPTTQGILDNLYVENKDKGQPIVADDISISISKIELSITTGAAPLAGASYQEVPFNTTTKQIRKYNNSGTLLNPNFCKFTIKANYYGDTATRMAYDTDYFYKLDPNMESELYTLVNALTAANEAVSAQN